MSTTFKPVKENFTCERCETEVSGTGYTNHCPQCLWSKHVDESPGDRLADCGGLMEPVAVENEGADTILVHRCVKCFHVKRNKVAPDDAMDSLIALSKGKSPD